MAVQEFDLFEGLIYTTPEVPALTKIRGYRQKKHNQVWQRHTEYLDWSWNDDPKNGALWWDEPEDGQAEWYYAEIDRILNGEWVMIEGRATYLNLFAYFYHQWFVTKEGEYPEYRDTSLEFCRFIQVVYSDNRCRGGNTMKGRRKGISTICMSIMLQFGLIKQNIEQGITSKSAIDAEKIFKLMLVNGYASLPNFLKPRLSGNDLPVKTMNIMKQPGRIAKGKQTGSAKEGLNNKIEWRAPSLNVFDGDGLWMLLLDECGKWIDLNIDEYLEIAMNIIVAGKSIGRIVAITTVNKGDKGGDNYKVVWDNSSQLVRDRMGQTNNKLYRYFMVGYKGGRDGGWIDQYGNSVWDTPTPEQTEFLKKDPNTLDPYMGCKEYCELQRKIKENDPEKLQEEIRMFPFNPEEVFDAANKKCHFKNPKEINEQAERVESKIATNRNLYRRGYFKKHPDTGKIVFSDEVDKGWYILDLLDDNESNKFVMKGGKKAPANTSWGAGGVDTFANSETTAETGSDASIAIHKKYNALDEDNSGMPAALFLERPPNKKFFNQQIFYAFIFYGIKGLIERAPTDWYDYAEAEGLLEYCIKTKRSLDGKEVYGISPQNTNAIEQHLTEMVEYAEFNVEKIWFLPIIKSLIPFNVKDRLKFDALVAWGYALMACKEATKAIIPEKVKQQVIKTYKLKVNGRAA